MPRREGGEGEGVSVRHGGWFDSLERSARDDAPCQPVERRRCLDTIRSGIESRSHNLLEGKCCLRIDSFQSEGTLGRLALRGERAFFLTCAKDYSISTKAVRRDVALL